MAKNAIEQALDLRVTQRLDLDNKRWCRWLRDAREGQGLSRMELAERMGYRKLQRGAAKIARWERGDDVPRSDRIPLLAQTLGLSEEQIAAQARREREQLTTLAHNDLLLRKASSAASLFDVRLLGRYGDLLLGRSAQVFQDLAGADLRVTGAMVVQAYMGGASLSLDELLGEWLAGRFQFSCGECGATVRCHYGGGSPLSGNHKLAGWCAVCARRVTGRIPPDSPREHRLAHILMGLKKRRQAPRAQNQLSGWTLGQYLASRFSVDVPDIRVTDTQGDVVAMYRHESGILKNRGGETLAVVPSASTCADGEDQPVWQEQWGAASEKGTLVVGSLSPLRAGGWQGESLVFDDHNGRSWCATPGVLRNPSGRPVFRLDGPLPRAALKALIQVCRPNGKKQLDRWQALVLE